MIRLELPFKIPSSNHLYFFRGKMMFMLTAARKLQKQIFEICAQYSDKAEELIGEKLHVTAFVYDRWMNNDGLIRKKDIMNAEKFLMDSVCKGLGLDDSQIWRFTMVKEHTTGDPHVEVVVSSYNSGTGSHVSQ